MPQPPKDDLYILPDEYKPSSRHKRSLLKSHRNEELNVETLVVVDRKMMENHGHGNITTYVLTVLNMVGLAFLKPQAYVCVSVCVRACVHTWLCMCIPVCVCICVCACVCPCVHYVYVFMCVCLYACLCVCTPMQVSFLPCKPVSWYKKLLFY